MTATMVGRGLYDAPEVGRLCGLSADRVVRWATDSSRGHAIVAPSFERLFSFDDLVSFTVAATVAHRGVSDRHLRRGIQELRNLHRVPTPLAFSPIVSTLATSGASFIRRVITSVEAAAGHEWEDIGRGGQGTFRNIVEIDLKRIEFGNDGSPQRWVPMDGIVMDPAIQAGAPCIAGTRVPTDVAADLAGRSGIDDVVFDLDLSSEQVERAVEFEVLLAKGQGIAA